MAPIHAVLAILVASLWGVAFAALALGDRPTGRQLIGMVLGGGTVTVFGLALTLPTETKPRAAVPAGAVLHYKNLKEDFKQRCLWQRVARQDEHEVPTLP